jgi:trehalose/maltose hydrolase-like predicted phosphorylase
LHNKLHPPKQLALFIEDGKIVNAKQLQQNFKRTLSLKGGKCDRQFEWALKTKRSTQHPKLE